MRVPFRCTGHVVLGVVFAVASLGQVRTARADDRTSAEAILKPLDAKSNRAAKQSLDALERATRLRGAGDEARARLAEGLALEWAELARDHERTLAAEKEARASEAAAIEAGARVERERALLEEAIARGGRLRAELAKVTAKGASHPGKEHPTTFVAGASSPPEAPKGASPRGPKGSSPVPPATHVDADAPAADGARGAGGGR